MTQMAPWRSHQAAPETEPARPRWGSNQGGCKQLLLWDKTILIGWNYNTTSLGHFRAHIPAVAIEGFVARYAVGGSILLITWIISGSYGLILSRMGFWIYGRPINKGRTMVQNFIRHMRAQRMQTTAEVGIYCDGAWEPSNVSLKMKPGKCDKTCRAGNGCGG